MPSKSKPAAKSLGTIVWDNPIPTNIDGMMPKMGKFIMAGLEYESSNVQDHARQTAPWNDITGNARNGLFAKAYSFDRAGGSLTASGAVFGIVLFHTMPYGLWLEVRHSGQYAVIAPTIIDKGPEVMETLKRILERMT